MLNKKNKYNIRLLPIFIFIAVLTLSVKINSVFDQFKDPTLKLISISQAQALAEEKINKETKELSQALDHGGSKDKTPSQENNAFTQSEIVILQELAERREALDVRSKEIDKKAIQLKIAEEEIDKKLKQLQNYEQKLQKLIAGYNAKEKEKISSMVKLYSAMKPKDAARIFDKLDMDILVALLKEMKPSTSSAILAQMNAEKARIVTAEMMSTKF